MTIHPQQLVERMLRQELYAFTGRVFETLHPGEILSRSWHIEAMCHHLMQVEQGDCRRLLITVPPRHLKSITASVAFTAWLLGRNPARRIMVASYGDDLAAKHGQDCRTVMQAEWYSRLFPGTRLSRQIATDLQTSLQGARKAVSLGGAVTGFGADILVIDDMMKAADAASPAERQRVRTYFDETLVSRLNDKTTGAIVAIQQRLHEDDLAAYLIEKGNFRHLNLPAIAEEDETVELGRGRVHRRRQGGALFPVREPLATLEAMRRDMGAAAFSAQYQQNPVAPGGNRFRWEWVRTYDGQTRPARGDLLQVVQSWDTAYGTEPGCDWSVCTIWGMRRDGVWLLLEVERARLDFPALKARVIALQARWYADKVLIEHAAAGLSLLQDLHRDCRNDWIEPSLGTFLGIKPRGDKATRFDAQTGKVEAGEVLFPSHAPWLATLKNELLAFPLGRHDDQVDSLSQFLFWLGSRRGDSATRRGLNGGTPPRPRSRLGKQPTRPRPRREGM